MKLQGSLSLPANYEKGKTYPTIVYIYEKLTNGHNSFATPSANGFNKSAYTSNGYAVLQPDITYRLNDPGVSAVLCITAAVKAAIATGVVDARHVGLPPLDALQHGEAIHVFHGEVAEQQGVVAICLQRR